MWSLGAYIGHMISSKGVQPKPNWPGVGCTTLDLVCTSCTCGVQEYGAISLVVLQTTEIG